MLREMELDWIITFNHQDEESDELTRARSAREDLRELIAELQSVVVAPPKLLWSTMEVLEADSLAFSPDFEESGHDGAETDRIIIRRETVAELAVVAERAAGRLNELEARLRE
jgi:hypothetical protein